MEVNPSAQKPRTWCVAIVLASVVLLYYHVFVSLFHDWRVNEDYSHGFFIPLISGYMIYGMRHELKEMVVRPVNWGLAIFLLGLIQLYVATVGTEYFLQRTSLILVLFGCSLFLLGSQITKRLSAPIAYLVFMVPLPAIIWNKIAFPMQLFASAITERAVRSLGIPIFREGNILHLANTTLEVVNACSGLRSLMTMFALSAALTMFSSLSAGKNWMLFFAAAPIAMLANTLRLTGTAVLASRYGEEVAQGFLHDFSGMVVFVLGLALLIGVNVLLVKTSTTETHE
ncbi:exosortase/archaeosortase family protein [Desulfogranum marinum]|uniref:exosortase/archaeosortase family protein n=1 Tax=Desulfogranum marinum TaxID=453220 RepID=UPI0029C832FF|nr:exosortase/archaeosortase family protein [Desulfogranum marinum]